MTSVATIMGAVPVAYGVGAGSAARKPLGYAIVGGVFFSTALTLFVVPIAYLMFDSAVQRVRAGRRVFVPLPKGSEGD
jgi:HAE1 family hydrophobic/amphiphilic exporter-1